MKYVSLDLETTCIDPKCPENILQIAMVVEDTKDERDVEDLPSFKAILVPETGLITGSLTALAMNTWIMIAIEMHKKSIRCSDGYTVSKAINELKVYFTDLGVPSETLNRASNAFLFNRMLGLQSMIREANDFLDEEFGKNATGIIVAGKNVAGFDMMFLPKDLKRRFAHRTIDPGSVLIDWDQKAPPSSNDLANQYKAANPSADNVVYHDAYQDAKDVITWLRQSYPSKEVI
jgi:hypothetical protein